jgi:hypothetical protein
MGKFTTPGVLHWSAFIPNDSNDSDGTVCDFGEYTSCIVIGGKNITSNVSNVGNKDTRVDCSNDVGGRKDSDLKMTDNTVKGMMMLQEDKSAMDCSVGWTISSRCNIPIAQYKHNTTDFQLIVEQSSSSPSPSPSHEKSKLISSRKQQVTAGKDLLTRKPPSSSYIQKNVEVAIQIDTLDIIINGPKNAFINEPIELTITIVNNSSTDEVKSPTIMTEREYLKRDFSEIGHSDISFGIARSYLMHITSKLLRYELLESSYNFYFISLSLST